MLLSVRKQQEYLKALGFYTGAIDGIVGKLTKKAYKDLQETYFIRNRDIDGKYGKNTDMLLRNAYNVFMNCKNFKLTEFKCKCNGYCTGYPALLDFDLLKNLQSLRDKFGKITITSGLRCKKHNAKLFGSSSTSRHLSGRAVDLKCDVSVYESGRQLIMDFWRSLPQQRYTYCSLNGKNLNMGTSVHVDVQ